MPSEPIVDSFRVCPAEYQDNEDPLEILGGGPRRILGVDNSPASLDTETAWRIVTPPAVPSAKTDPMDFIDAMLRRSKHVRNEVFSRQARVLDEYNNESHQIEKELAVLPPTYSEYLTVREGLNSRHRQRAAAMVLASVSHPLNFHLLQVANCDTSRKEARGSLGIEDRKDRLADGVSTARDGPKRTPEIADGEEVGGEKAHRDKKDMNSKEGKRDSPVRRRERSGSDGEGSPTNRFIEDHGPRRRCNSRARAGSASAMLLERPLTSCRRRQVKEHFRCDGWRRSERDQGRAYALRQSKVRGRNMIFSLLEAAHAEEKAMEERVSACLEASASGKRGHKERAKASRKLDEARVKNARELYTMLAEYKPQPDKRNRKHDRAKSCIAALPWPNVFKATQAGAATGTPRNTTSKLKTFPSAGPARWNSSSDRHHWCTNDVEEEFSLEEHSGAVPSSARSRAVTTREGTPKKEEDDADYEILAGRGGDRYTLDGGNDQTKVAEGDINGSHVEGGDDGGLGNGSGRECRTSSGRPIETVLNESLCADAKSGAITSGVEESGADYRTPEDPGVVPSQSSNSGAGCQASFLEEEAGQKGSKDLSDALRSGARPPSRSPSMKFTLPDPYEVNASVLADVFNMDHLKDLPGIVGGQSCQLSDLVSSSVTDTDPAFPNLECHRRTAMDRACSFMPGYKPRVNSSGPDAGAYLLDRRHSYRVKMAAPAHETRERGISHRKNRKRRQKHRL